MFMWYFSGIDYCFFLYLFEMSDSVFVVFGIQCCWVGVNGGYFCWISLSDFVFGSELFLLFYVYLLLYLLYCVVGLIFVQCGVICCVLLLDEVFLYVQCWLILMCVYDYIVLMYGVQVCVGIEVVGYLDVLFVDLLVVFVQLYNVVYGCFLCQVDWVGIEIVQCDFYDVIDVMLIM